MPAVEAIQTRRTVLELRQLPDGDWQVTQAGVNESGRGKTAAAAAADFCIRVAAKVETDD